MTLPDIIETLPNTPQTLPDKHWTVLDISEPADRARHPSYPPR